MAKKIGQKIIKKQVKNKLFLLSEHVKSFPLLFHLNGEKTVKIGPESITQIGTKSDGISKGTKSNCNDWAVVRRNLAIQIRPAAPKSPVFFGEQDFFLIFLWF